MHPCVLGCACVYVSVYVCIPVREPHALSAEVGVRSERAGRPPGDPNHTQAMHYRRNQGEGRLRMRLPKNGTPWRRTEGCRMNTETVKGNSLGLFLQIVLLQTLAG